MSRLAGIFLVVLALYAAVLASSENARALDYQQQLAGWLGFWGVVTLGAGVLIVSGGIDLSIGSVVGLGAVTLGLLLEKGVSPFLAIPAVLVGSVLIGLAHGLLVTLLRLQPFLVTLCGLFIYRGVAQGITDSSVGLGSDPATQWLRDLFIGSYGQGARNQLAVLLVLAVVLGLFLHGTKHGRYLFAIGANEDAARYAGIRTNLYKIAAFVISSGMAGVAAVLFHLENEGSNPTTAGAWLELYAITGAVLGGCSLRGGEGMVPGMLLGAAVLPLLRALRAFSGYSSDVEYAIIGVALLAGTIADEMLKRQSARRTGA